MISQSSVNFVNVVNMLRRCNSARLSIHIAGKLQNELAKARVFNDLRFAAWWPVGSEVSARNDPRSIARAGGDDEGRGPCWV